MTDEFVSAAQPVSMDRWNRYVLPDPITGQTRAWTRITTITKTLSDTYHLEAWKRRSVARGVALREDLHALAATHDVSDKGVMDKVCEDAMSAAGASEGANKGTARHKLIERYMTAVDGDTLTLTESNSAFLKEYRNVMDKHDISFEYSERIVCMPQYGIAGRLDAVVNYQQLPTVFDLKTQKTVDFGHIELAMQLGFYAKAPFMWNEVTNEWEHPPSRVRGTYALLCHAPFTTNKIDLYEVDLSHSLDLIEKALAVREARKIKGLLTKI